MKTDCLFNKTCPVCGKEFSTPNPRYIYCSAECREIGMKRYRQKYYKSYGKQNETCRSIKKRRLKRKQIIRNELTQTLKKLAHKPRWCPYKESCFECPHPDGCIKE